MSARYDAIVIGSGQAGPFLAARLAQAGMKTALVEKVHLGGTCVNDGCIPTKTLVASARTAQVARLAAQYGVHIGGPITVDMAAVKARKDRVVGQSVDNLTSWLHDIDNLTVVWGHARFVGAHAIAVDVSDGSTHVLEAPRIFVNVGGRAVLPDWPGIHEIKARNRLREWITCRPSGTPRGRPSLAWRAAGRGPRA